MAKENKSEDKKIEKKEKPLSMGLQKAITGAIEIYSALNGGQVSTSAGFRRIKAYVGISVDKYREFALALKRHCKFAEMTEAEKNRHSANSSYLRRLLGVEAIRKRVKNPKAESESGLTLAANVNPNGLRLPDDDAKTDNQRIALVNQFLTALEHKLECSRGDVIELVKRAIK